MPIAVINKRGASYLPEANAYAKFLRKKGWEVLINEPLKHSSRKGKMVEIYFPGILPPNILASRKYLVEIHDYTSASTPPFCLAKNLAKRLLNRSPNGRVFLNEYVRKAFSFEDTVPWIVRDMGVDDAFFEIKTTEKSFDFVYCGSIREGVESCFVGLLKRGYSILFVGRANAEFSERMSGWGGWFCAGVVDRDAVPALIAKAKCGINFNPNVEPFNQQTSTKVLEYLSVGLAVISNRYSWINSFSTRFPNQPIYWFDCEEDIGNALANEGGEANINEMKRFSWDSVLSSAKFDDFLKGLVDHI